MSAVAYARDREHHLDYPELLERDFARLKDSFQTLISSAGAGTVHLRRLYLVAVELLSVTAMVKPRSSLLARSVRVAGQASAGLFQMLSADRERVEVVIDRGPPVMLDRVRPRMATDAVAWQRGLACATVARDPRAVRALLAVSSERMGSDGVQVDPVHHAWVEALRSSHRGDGEFKTHLAHARALASVEHAPIMGGESTWLARHHALMDALAALVERNLARFGDAISRALAAHRAFWSRDDERIVTHQGFIAMSELSLVCQAHDAGMSIDIRSPYLPVPLITGEFDGPVDSTLTQSDVSEVER